MDVAFIRYCILFLMSGATVVAVTILAEKGETSLAGLFVFSPIVSLFSFLFIAFQSGAETLQKVAINASIVAPAVLIYSLFLVLLSTKIAPILSVFICVGIWFVAAFILLEVFR